MSHIEISQSAINGTGTPAGLDGQVQFNDGGNFGADAGLAYNKTTDSLSIGGGLIVNEDSNDVDSRIEGSTDANLMFFDAGNDYVGIGTNVPDQKLTVNGNFNVRDSDANNRQYRFRTSGTDLDFDFAGGDLYLSGYEVNFEGTQYFYMRFYKAGNDLSISASITGKKDNNLFGSTYMSLAQSGYVFNESGDDADFRVEGDTDANMLVVDASTDRVGIGTAAPAQKLDIAGSVLASGIYRTNSGISNNSSSNNSYLQTLTTGALITRDVADANPSLIVQQVNASSTGNILELKNNTNNQITMGRTGSLIVNEAGNDADSRFEGDTDVNLLYVDAGTDRVGIGSAAPASKLTVNGDVEVLTSANGLILASPDATRWRLAVSNAGVLSAASI